PWLRTGLRAGLRAGRGSRPGAHTGGHARLDARPERRLAFLGAAGPQEKGETEDCLMRCAHLPDLSNDDGGVAFELPRGASAGTAGRGTAKAVGEAGTAITLRVI